MAAGSESATEGVADGNDVVVPFFDRAGERERRPHRGNFLFSRAGPERADGRKYGAAY